MKQRVFSGTRATGKLHLGNYFGAVKGYIALQENPELECLYMVMDLHAITTPYNARELSQLSQDVILDYLAAGLDPQKAIITKQSLIPEHPYLSFLFASIMSVARMQHLPTYKEKIKQYPHNVTMALLNYPILMAADILLYKASLVPVGIDQEPHLEIAREVARKMNDLYQTSFPQPQRFATASGYVPSLTGEGKMSKSVVGSFINLTDNLETIKTKLAAVPTDSGTGKVVPSQGSITNLLLFVELFQGKDKRLEYEHAYMGNGIRYGELKNNLAQAIFNTLEPIQEKRSMLEKKPDYIQEVMSSGAKRASQIAQATLLEVKEKMGLL